MSFKEVFRFKETGLELFKTLNDNKHLTILDLGCDYNYYKQVIPSIIGVDLLNPAADIMADITNLPFTDNYADIILLLGVLYYEGMEIVYPGIYSDTPESILDRQLTEIVRVAKLGATIYCRLGACSMVNKQTLNSISKRYNLHYIVEPKDIMNTYINQHRLYWVWKVYK